MISKEKADFLISLADPNGHISPSHVIEVARDPATPIHTDFDWDDATAAAQFRLEQARTLIRFVKLNVVIRRQTVVAPYYVVDPARPPRSQRYVELTTAGRDREMSQQILLAELDRIAAAIRRAQEIAAVLGLSDELDQLLEDVSAIKTQAERKAQEKRRTVKGGAGKRASLGTAGTARPGKARRGETSQDRAR